MICRCCMIALLDLSQCRYLHGSLLIVAYRTNDPTMLPSLLGSKLTFMRGHPHSVFLFDSLWQLLMRRIIIERERLRIPFLNLTRCLLSKTADKDTRAGRWLSRLLHNCTCCLMLPIDVHACIFEQALSHLSLHHDCYRLLHDYHQPTRWVSLNTTLLVHHVRITDHSRRR
jgi:hypothetical protein